MESYLRQFLFSFSLFEIIFHSLSVDQLIVGVSLYLLAVNLERLDFLDWIGLSIPITTLRKNYPITESSRRLTIFTRYDCNALFTANFSC